MSAQPTIHLQARQNLKVKKFTLHRIRVRSMRTNLSWIFESVYWRDPWLLLWPRTSVCFRDVWDSYTQVVSSYTAEIKSNFNQYYTAKKKLQRLSQATSSHSLIIMIAHANSSHLYPAPSRWYRNWHSISSSRVDVNMKRIPGKAYRAQRNLISVSAHVPLSSHEAV